MKSVQIPYDLFIDLAMYHLRGEDDYEEEIRQGLEQKLDAMLNRQLYFYSYWRHKITSFTPEESFVWIYSLIKALLIIIFYRLLVA